MALPHETRDSGSYYEQSYLQDEDTVALLRDDQFFCYYSIAPHTALTSLGTTGGIPERFAYSPYMDNFMIGAPGSAHGGRVGAPAAFPPDCFPTGHTIPARNIKSSAGSPWPQESVTVDYSGESRG
jgi:hypothetical protein